MHALQHGIQNKRHIVNTKGTISPLLLIYTVLHHSVVRSTVVAIHSSGNAHTVGARNEPDETATKDKTTLWYS